MGSCTILTFPKMVATYASVLCWGPVLPPSCENPFLVTLGLSRKPIKLCISSFYKVLGTVLGTVAHRHLPNTQLCGTMALIANHVIFQIVISTWAKRLPRSPKSFCKLPTRFNLRWSGLSELLQASYTPYGNQNRLSELLQPSYTLPMVRTDSPNFCKFSTRFAVVKTDSPIY